jgi:hypothetical protein
MNVSVVIEQDAGYSIVRKFLESSTSQLQRYKRQYDLAGGLWSNVYPVLSLILFVFGPFR